MYSDKLRDICTVTPKLPTKPMQEIRQGWVIMAWELGMIVRQWLIDAVRHERMKISPKQFQRATKVSLTGEELTSETHRVMG